LAIIIRHDIEDRIAQIADCSRVAAEVGNIECMRRRGDGIGIAEARICGIISSRKIEIKLVWLCGGHAAIAPMRASRVRTRSASRYDHSSRGKDKTANEGHNFPPCVLNRIGYATKTLCRKCGMRTV